MKLSQRLRRGDGGGTIIALGGVIDEISVDGKKYIIHSFYATDEFILLKPKQLDVLIVAGGGAGANGNCGSGGGAGGLINQQITPVAGSYLATIGLGGYADRGENGQNSSIFDLVAIGGGGGVRGGNSPSDANRNGKDGGSGGGGAGWFNGVSTPSVGGTPVEGQGNAGGSSFKTPHTYSRASGGGGGAGGPGGDGVEVYTNTLGVGGNGGLGFLTNIRGITEYFAGGGGGASSSMVSQNAHGVGGSNIGGDGGAGHTGLGSIKPATSGASNTGSGGGGAPETHTVFGAGGSGIIIIRYRA